jgi:hypothetical protein
VWGFQPAWPAEGITAHGRGDSNRGIDKRFMVLYPIAAGALGGKAVDEEHGLLALGDELQVGDCPISGLPR